MKNFSLKLELAFAVTLAVAGGAVLSWWQVKTRALPPRPRLDPLHTFVGYYEPAGSAEHSLYPNGIMGFRHRFHDANILILGTSHVLFGISAIEMQQMLSAKLGRDIRAFNMGLVFGEGTTFAAEILERNGVEKRELLVDLFSEFVTGESPAALSVEKDGSLVSYAKVLKIWMHYWSDWLLDPMLPALHLDRLWKTDPVYERWLGNTLFQDFASGDCRGVWIASYGERYVGTKVSHPLGSGDPFAGAPNRAVGFSEAAERILSTSGDTVVYLLLPFEGYRKVVVPGGHVFLAMDEKNLTYIDQHHVDSFSRDIVTQRLVDSILANKGLVHALGRAATPPQRGDFSR